MKTKILIALSAMAFMSACGSKSDDSRKNKLSIPNAIEDKITVGPELTLEEKAKLTIFFQEKVSLSILEDIYSPAGEATSTSESRKQRLQNAGPVEKELIRDIQQDCQIQNPNEENLPEETQPRAGQKAHTQVASSISGPNCPIEKGRVIQKDYEIVSVDASTNSGEMKTVSREESSVKMNSDKWIEKSGIVERKLVIETQWFFRQENEARELYMKKQISGNYQNVKRSLLINGTGERIEKRQGHEDENVTEVLRTHLALEDVRVDLTLVQKNEGEKVASEYYINGHPVSSKQLTDIFGKPFIDMLKNH